MKNITTIIKILKKNYPKSATALKHSNVFELLIATILSAQCTDERVNTVMPELLKKHRKPSDFAKAKLKDIEKIIRSTGFYKSKALSLKETSKTITEKFNGEVPQTMKELLSLRGVARKTANVVLGYGYNIADGIVVDTHVKRLAFRIGFSKNTNPEKTEKDLMKIIDKKDWIWLSGALINHGRKICSARKPLCEKCPLKNLCQKNN